MQRASKAPLLHMCNDHAHCNVKWCAKLQADKQGKPYENKQDLQLQNAIDKKVYDDLKSVVNLFSEPKVLSKSLHPYNSQINEALNKAQTMLTPKHINFSLTQALISHQNLHFSNLYAIILCYSQCFHSRGWSLMKPQRQKLLVRLNKTMF